MEIYELRIDDMTTLGHMGSSPTLKERKLFTNTAAAKDYAEADYGKAIKWQGDSRRITSGDLSFVMYDIYAREVAN